MRRVLAALATSIVFAALAALVPIGRAMACSCAMPNAADAFAQSAVVFEGVVASSSPLAQGDGFMDVAFTFAVENELKGGPLPERLAIATSGSGASCGAEFQVGQRWRVFASISDGALYSGLCSSNRLIDERAPIPPLADEGGGSTPGGAGLGLTTPVLVGLGAVALLGLISVLAFRYRPRTNRH